MFFRLDNEYRGDRARVIVFKSLSETHVPHIITYSYHTNTIPNKYCSESTSYKFLSRTRTRFRTRS